MTGFDWDAIFICFLSWLTSFSFSWTTSLTGTLEGNAGGLDFLNISARVFNASVFPFPNLTSGLSGAGLYSAYIKSYAE